LRHVFAFARGEDIDPDSGLPHLDHAACCILFLSSYQKTGTGNDDRYKPSVEMEMARPEKPPEWVHHKRPGFPQVVCLCGSTRFHEAFAKAQLSETIEGRIVLSVGCHNASDEQLGIAQDSDVKKQLDELHLRKIDMCDQILVLNVNGYVGSSTANEIAYAKSKGKLIRYLEP
jgi:hypothetical protein